MPVITTELTSMQNRFNGPGGPVLDQYTPIIGGDAFDQAHGFPKWLPAVFRRRILAYQFLDQLYSLVDPPLAIQADMSPLRNGTVPYAIQVLRDLTLGGEQKIVVKGAAGEDASPAVVAQQELMTEWADRNMFFPKLQKAEELTAYLGDVFIKMWIGKTDGQKDVKLDVIHPSFAFPSFDNDGLIIEMTLIWEEYREQNNVSVLMLYKDYYTIGPDGFVYETAGWYQFAAVPSLNDLSLQEYELTDDGVPIKNLKLDVKQIPVYHIPNFWTHYGYGESDLCYYAQSAQELNACDTDMASAARLMGIPPLVLAGLKARVKGDSSQTTANDVQSIGPGAVINLDSNTHSMAQYLDNSKMLDCLIKYTDRSEDRFFRNLRLGKLFSGKTDHIRDIESQKAFKTLMASLYARIAQKRTSRKSVFSRLLRGVREMLTLVDSPALYPEKALTLELGNILPLDNSDDLTVLSTIWSQGKGYISADTAARLGQKAGTGVVDLKKESEKITEQLSLLGKGMGGDTGTTPPNKKFTLRPPKAA